MSRARPAHRSFAVAAAVLLAALATIPAQAASPGASTSALRRGGPAWDQPTGDDPSRLIVTFKPGTTPASRRTTLQASGARQTTKLPNTRSVALQAPAGRAKEVAATLRADPHVLRVSVDHRRYRAADPTGEQYWGELWGLENLGQKAGYPRIYGTVDADIDARQALGITTGDPATVVAVIDDGVDFSHPDLAARAWTNPGESGEGRETNGIDDDANGYIDDVHGWDFCHDDNTVHDFDDDGHGTHVAGTLAASLNGVGVVGVAPNISIMALKFIGNDPRLRARLGRRSPRSSTPSRSGSRSSTPRGAAAGGRRTRPSCTTRSPIRGCSSWPLPATTATTATPTRCRACRPRSTCRTSCRWPRSTTRADSRGSRTTARRPSISPHRARGS